MSHITYHDVSHFQPNYQPTWHTVMKVTQGGSFVDSEWRQIASRCDAKGFRWLGYHFLEHGNITGQVTNFLNQAGKNQCLMLDVESVVSGGVTQAGRCATWQDVLNFADEYMSRSTGFVSLLYLPQWYWAGSFIGHPPLDAATARGMALISSNPYGSYSDTAAGWNEYKTTQHGVTFTAGIKPDIWQYTATPLDTNAFKGTEAHLLDLWFSGNSHPSAPVDGVDMPLTQADADLVVDTLMKRGLGNDGNPIVAVALDRAAQAFTIDALMKQTLGNSGPTVDVALQSTYNTVKAIAAALNPATLATIVAQAVELAGVDVPAATLQTALVGALKELAAAAPPAAV